MAPNSGPLTKNLYPFDVIQLTSVNGQDEKQQSPFKKAQASTKRSDLLKLLRLVEYHSFAQPKNQPKSTVTQKFTVEFFAETSLQMIKLYFAQTNGLFSLAVSIEDSNDHSLVFHKVYPPHTVAQFSDHAIYNSHDDLKDYALTIGNLDNKCTNLTIKLQFSGLLPDKTPPVPSCFIEFYGKIEEQLESKAI